MLKDRIKKFKPKGLGSSMNMSEIITSGDISGNFFTTALSSNSRSSRARQFRTIRELKGQMSVGEDIIKNYRCKSIAEDIITVFLDRNACDFKEPGYDSILRASTVISNHIQNMTGCANVHVDFTKDRSISLTPNGVKFFFDAIDYKDNDVEPLSYFYSNGFFKFKDPSKVSIYMTVPYEYLKKSIALNKAKVRTELGADVDKFSNSSISESMASIMIEDISSMIFYGFIASLYRDYYREAVDRDLVTTMRNFTSNADQTSFLYDEKRKDRDVVIKRLMGMYNDKGLNDDSRYGLAYLLNLVESKNNLPSDLNVYDLMDLYHIADNEVMSFMTSLFGREVRKFVELTNATSDDLIDISNLNETSIGARLILFSRIAMSCFGSFYALCWNDSKKVLFHKFLGLVEGSNLRNAKGFIRRDTNYLNLDGLCNKMDMIYKLEKESNNPLIHYNSFSNYSRKGE